MWRLPLVLQHHATIQQYMGTLENLLFTAELDHHILAVYQQFCALQLWDAQSRWNVYLCSPDVMKRHITNYQLLHQESPLQFYFYFPVWCHSFHSCAATSEDVCWENLWFVVVLLFFFFFVFSLVYFYLLAVLLWMDLFKNCMKTELEK